MVAQVQSEVQAEAMPPPEAADDPADETAGPLSDSHSMFAGALRDSAQYEGDPLAAMVRFEAANLHEFGGKFQRLLDAAVERAESLNDLDDMDPSIKRRLDILRQCAQFDQLAFKMAEFNRRGKKSD